MTHDPTGRTTPADAQPATPEQLLATARTLSTLLAADAARLDAERVLPHDAFDRVRASGLLAARVPRRHGGAALDYQTLSRISVLLAKGDASVAQALLPHHVSIEAVAVRATPDQRERWFGQVVREGAVFSGAIAERGTRFRTDIKTRLTPQGHGRWQLDGRKFYTTGGLLADLLRVVALTPDKQVVSVVLPRLREGVTLLDDWDGMGQRATASGTTELVAVQVTDEDIMPRQSRDGEPWNYASAAGQLMHCTIEVGIALAVLDDAVAWAREGARPVRESGVERSVDDAYVQHTVGNIAATAHAAEAMVARAAVAVDRAAEAWWAGQLSDAALDTLGVEASIAVAEAKIVATQAALRAAEQFYEVGGASATLRRHNFDRHWRNARTHTTHDPVAYKVKAVGAYHLSGTRPPNALTY
ncbi:acyl-CoA dehydrogenase family protein [Pseudorhodoferax sp.]|uniref:acyl-CoA dehydrogenase family protein n=1 Tax=Pseudorhodoferax sp. TaxID=1993553 RepID=UPI002DD62603|nr:acyl-CoA dehydrogenase family protein [Pseudorhodoferax sp.]